VGAGSDGGITKRKDKDRREKQGKAKEDGDRRQGVTGAGGEG
jgi:hypothetical protein